MSRSRSRRPSGSRAAAIITTRPGALRDMVQNHMLQLLALVAMEPPSDFDATAVRDEKVKVLRALRPITAADVEALTRHRPIHARRDRWRDGARL